MQTLKTAAIVVLLVTVMYGAYVSITTPPREVGPEIEELVLGEGDLDIDVGLPDSLGAMDLSLGSPESDFQKDYASEETGQPADGDFTNPTGATFGELGGADASPESAGGDTPKDQPSLAGLKLPKSNGSTPRFNIDPNQEYASTGNQFAMPSAEQATAEMGIGETGGAAPSWDGDAPNARGAGSDSAKTDAAGSPAVRNNPLFAGDDQNSADSSPELPTSDTSSDTSPDAAAGQPSRPNFGLVNAIQMADKQYQEDRKKEALATLSLFSEKPDLTDQERESLLGRLDALAREVIYSQDHLLAQPHRVQPNETLMEIAARHEVPWQLLANINGIDDPITVLPGTDLKIVEGPFRADVDLKRNELTLYVADLYAGRFPIAVGADPVPKTGTFTVQDKQSARTYYNQNGAPVPPGSPNNPYGSMWIDLGGDLCIHGSPSTTQASTAGCISVAGRYAGDLYGILSEGSSITIRR